MTPPPDMSRRLCLGSVLAAALAATGAMTTVAAAQARPLSFAGRPWTVKQTALEAVGPGPNHFAPLPELTRDGTLRLRIAKRAAHWACSEVVLQQSLGYGQYEFDIEAGPLDANVVLGLFLWSDAPAQNHREIDIEVARWGQPSLPDDSQFVVQPYEVPGNLRRFSLDGARKRTLSFRWSPGRVDFNGRGDNGASYSWTHQSQSVPTPGDETARINLWLFEGRAPADGAPAEVLVRDFRFLPLGQA